MLTVLAGQTVEVGFQNCKNKESSGYEVEVNESKTETKMENIWVDWEWSMGREREQKEYKTKNSLQNASNKKQYKYSEREGI